MSQAGSEHLRHSEHEPARRADGYERRRPEATALYQSIAEHWPPNGTLVFHELLTPSCAEVANIARRTAQRLHQAFRKQGRTSPWDGEAAFADSGETDAFSSEQPGLFACYQAAALGFSVSGERACRIIYLMLTST